MLVAAEPTVVMAKVAALALLGGLGLAMRRRLAAWTEPALRWAVLETAVMAVTLGLAAALSQTAA